MHYIVSARRQTTLLVALIGLLALSFPAPANAKRIIKVAQIKTRLSATRAPDGTITAEVIFSSRNPKCLSKKLARRLSDGYYHEAGGALYYENADGFGNPPESGWLFPNSRPSRRRWIWKAVWPGDAPVTVENFKDPGLPYHSTVADADRLFLTGGLGGKLKWRRRGVKIKLVCKDRSVSHAFTL